MNINYNDEIMKLISSIKDNHEISEVLVDYNNIKNIRNGFLDDEKVSYVYIVREKYKKEIEIISNMRFIFNNIRNIATSVENRNDIYKEMDFLLHYLPRVGIYRYVNGCFKGKIDDELRNKLFCEDSNITYESLRSII